ncbi:substrate-binding domain-containing protein, partial [Anaerovibrio sp.]|uniref:substrate-binding domain-containing protein n=1 Tax=Anaerovibrio sp. TaxID=1872532 RepID=UPI003F144B12
TRRDFMQIGRMGRKLWLLAALLVAILSLAGCGGQTGGTSEVMSQEQMAGLKKLGDIQVIAREDGSGTRSTFAELAGFAGDGKGRDMTREDALVADNASAVIGAVSSNASAIGYVSRGAVRHDDAVKVLRVNGFDVASARGSYPLRRGFYLAYSGSLNELEQDFLTYVNGAGQELVGVSFGAVGKADRFVSNQAAGELRIIGSTSVAPLMSELAVAYEQINSHAIVKVVASDTADGLTRTMRGECSFGMASRELKDYEKELLNYRLIANDDIVVIVNKSNPLNSITLEQLREIYTGSATSWQDLYQK